MKLDIDTVEGRLRVSDGEHAREVALYSPEAFEIISDLWVKVGWNEKYAYSFSWFGRPIIQLPEDLVRAQEVIWQVRPDVVLETGIAHGGSLVFYASLLKAMGKGRVIGVDVEIKPRNRAAMEAHPLRHSIELIEGNSVDPAVVAQVRGRIAPGETVMVILDSKHTYAHVRAELSLYADLVSPGSFIVATDGIMQDLADVPRGQAGWRTDNPRAAARDFAESHPGFVLEQPARPFDESAGARTPTHWPGAWLRRIT